MKKEDRTESWRNRMIAAGYFKVCGFVPERDRQRTLDYMLKLRTKFEREGRSG